MKKKLFLFLMCLCLLSQLCKAQILSLQTNAAAGRYFYLAKDVFVPNYEQTYSGEITTFFGTNLIIEKLGFAWFGLNLGTGLKNCYHKETFKTITRIPRSAATIYSLGEVCIKWSFIDFSISPEIKPFQKCNFYLFGGYYQTFLYREKRNIISKMQDGAFPENLENGNQSIYVANNRKLKEQGDDVQLSKGGTFGVRYIFKNFTFELRDNYAKGKYRPIVWFDNHSLTLSFGYSFYKKCR